MSTAAPILGWSTDMTATGPAEVVPTLARLAENPARQVGNRLGEVPLDHSEAGTGGDDGMQTRGESRPDGTDEEHRVVPRQQGLGRASEPMTAAVEEERDRHHSVVAPTSSGLPSPEPTLTSPAGATPEALSDPAFTSPGQIVSLVSGDVVKSTPVPSRTAFASAGAAWLLGFAHRLRRLGPTLIGAKRRASAGRR